MQLKQTINNFADWGARLIGLDRFSRLDVWLQNKADTWVMTREYIHICLHGESLFDFSF